MKEYGFFCYSNSTDIKRAMSTSYKSGKVTYADKKQAWLDESDNHIVIEQDMPDDFCSTELYKNDNGTIVLDDVKVAEKAERDERQRVNNLLAGAYQQQNAVLDSNMTALYWEANGAELIGPKMAVYCDFMENLLWPVYHERKGNGSTDYDFSSIEPTATYSFLELKEELQSLKS